MKKIIRRKRFSQAEFEHISGMEKRGLTVEMIAVKLKIPLAEFKDRYADATARYRFTGQ